MSYQALARKWRPKTFAEVVGQEHVVAALANGLDHDRVHHAFLLTGTRGVGKTTLARVLAKALNCEQGMSSTPCNDCAACRGIDEGRFVDLIEVDAATRTKVDDTRELLDNVQYAPTQGRYKVYLIDEVHMLSGHSFNALLKTLEEPPPHVKFVLATTDPRKVPVTVLSRCLQFHLKALDIEQISGQLSRIVEAEGCAHDAPALALLARTADGSMRDALSLLDQALAYGGGEVRSEAVRNMLGLIETGYVHDLIDALIGADVAKVLDLIQTIGERAHQFDGVLDELLLQLHHLSMQQALPGSLAAKGVEQPWHAELAARVRAEDLQLFYQIGLIGKRDLPLAPDPRTGFEMVLLRMLAFQPGDTGTTVDHAPASPPRQAPAGDVTSKTLPSDWGALVAELNLSGLVGQLAANMTALEREGDVFKMALDPRHEYLLTGERTEVLAAALSEHLGQTVTLGVKVGTHDSETPAQEQQRRGDERQQQAEQEFANDPEVRDIMKRFGATIVSDSIRPRD